MAWVESVSPSFRARHESGQTDDAARVLDSLERTRERLDGLFDRTMPDVTVVLHSSAFLLDFARPMLPVARLLTAPSARRYLVGWAGPAELHVLAPRVLGRRASAVPGSREMLELAPAALYAGLVVAANNPDLPPPMTPDRVLRSLRWAWLVEGAGRYFAGQTEHARPAIARRLREGPRPAFPPGPRDAALLGGTVLDLVAREEGTSAAVRMATRLHPDGPRAALVQAFGGRSLEHSAGAWRSHLARLAAAPGGSELSGLSPRPPRERRPGRAR